MEPCAIVGPFPTTQVREKGGMKIENDKRAATCESAPEEAPTDASVFERADTRK